MVPASYIPEIMVNATCMTTGQQKDNVAYSGWRSQIVASDTRQTPTLCYRNDTHVNCSELLTDAIKLKQGR
jgi:hypothetical protein